MRDPGAGEAQIDEPSRQVGPYPHRGLAGNRDARSKALSAILDHGLLPLPGGEADQLEEPRNDQGERPEHLEARAQPSLSPHAAIPVRSVSPDSVRWLGAFQVRLRPSLGKESFNDHNLQWCRGSSPR